MPSASLSRRRLLVGLGSTAVVTGVAGCTDSQPTPATSDETADVEDESPTASSTPTTVTETTPTTATDARLDLREANVVAVAVEQQGNAYRFDVTLIHDDDGEEGYANWWQVETLDGEQLGRRELRHAHGTREFTRSETIVVPNGTTCVVVRGHDQTHGYGGQAMLVTVETGATAVVRQGSEKQSVADATCP